MQESVILILAEAPNPQIRHKVICTGYGALYYYGHSEWFLTSKFNAVTEVHCETCNRWFSLACMSM